MYETFFGLSERPFAAIPEIERYFPAASIELARKTASRCIERGEGPALVIGPPGAGKSLLLELLARQFSQHYQTVVLAAGHVGSRRGMLQSILYALHQPYRGLDDGELRLALVGHLIAARHDCEGLLLLVDEAHTLSASSLEELRMLTNVTSGGESCARLVLAGGSALEEMFASPKLDAFSQRVAARCYLGAMETSETVAYLERRLSHCGIGPHEVFNPDARHAVHRLTDGIPRLVNQVCDHALILAFAAGRRLVDAAMIEEAWADLQQLPAPWTSAAGDSGSASEQVVEFGDLEDGDEDLDAIPFLVREDRHTIDRAQARLDASQELLERLDEEFTPAGSIGPEVEIAFDLKPDPFDEAFAEEEVVIDRYALLDTDLFAGCPIVTSNEGRVLGVSLAAAARVVQTPAPSLWSPSESVANSISVQADTTGAFMSTVAIGTGPAESIPAARAPRDDGRVAATGEASPSRFAGESPFGRAYGAPGSQSRPVAESAIEEPDDSDLIVFEDEPPATTPIRPLQPVRRQEYRQLFAKLRRG